MEPQTQKQILFPAAAAFVLGLAPKALAVCPVCTVAVSTGVGVSRWLGVDDTVTGLWAGGVIVSFILWTVRWTEQQNIRFPGKSLAITVFYYLLLFVPLQYAGILGHPGNMLFGIDKFALGTAAGSCAFYAGAWGNERLKEKNKGRAYFPFQKVVMPVAPLIFLSIVFYYTTKSI